jgi:TIR domain
MTAAASGSVFISYRRQESSGLAGRLYDRLAARFGDDQVFMDVDTIALGVDFADVITQAVSTCEVLLAVIGPRWLTATDEDGQRRLDDPDDIVRLEVAAALERDVRVIPILVDGAVMPRRQELPEALAGLARRNALSLRHESFRSDADRLLAAIEPVLRPPAAPAPPRTRETGYEVAGTAEPRDDENLEGAFHTAMVDVYQRAKREAGYHATYFIQMVSDRGGLATARHLLHASSVSEGFTALWERHRLELTVEAVVLQERFAPLFSDEERKIARARLAEYGYHTGR